MPTAHLRQERAAVDQGDALVVGGPFFDDLAVGDVFDGAPGVTITTGHTALYQALTGDRLRLPLDAALSAAVTGRSEPLVHPLLVCNLAIGQTTTVTQRVRANLFYRGLVLLRPVFVGDTLYTTTEVVGMKQNRRHPDRPPTGLVALRVRTTNQHGDAVLDFWRCPMLPLRDADAETGAADDFEGIPGGLDPARLAQATGIGWALEPFARATASNRGASDVVVAGRIRVEGRDTITGAPELARLTLNMAAAHHDAAASPYGRRLVYGGHTISLAGAHVSRALPSLVTIVAWESCDHTGPVFEGDMVRTELAITDVAPNAAGALVHVHAEVWAQDPGGGEERHVLDWRLVGWAA